MSFRILVTGGRHYADRGHVWDALDKLHRERGIALLAHGATPTEKGGAYSLSIRSER